MQLGVVKRQGHIAKRHPREPNRSADPIAYQHFFDNKFESHGGFDQGAARFARGEGMWSGDDGIYFACTNGGKAGAGQVWRYHPSAFEGQPEEADSPGRLELFIEPNDTKLLQSADNLTIAPWGDLVICEDRPGDEVRLIGVTPEGNCYTLAHSHAHTEFAGSTFSRDGSTLFVNIQGEHLTLAISGPWDELAGRAVS